MGKEKKSKPDNKEQSARFVKTAERIKSENDKEEFEKACNKIIKTKIIKK
ncbi:MAG: hypothetical protein ACLQBQ_02045 [Smithella sp.]